MEKEKWGKFTKSPTVICSFIIPCEHNTIAADKAVLKIAFWPKFKKARLCCVFKAAFSYPEIQLLYLGDGQMPSKVTWEGENTPKIYQTIVPVLGKGNCVITKPQQ